MAIGLSFSLMLIAALVGGWTAGPRPTERRLREWDPVLVLSIAIPVVGTFFIVSAVLGACLTAM